MKRTTFSTVIYVALVFLSGGVVGAFAHRLYMLNTVVAGPPKPADWLANYRSNMHTRLSLSDEQMTQLDAVLAATGARMKDLKARYNQEARERSHPEMKAIQEEQVRKINGFLSEPQRAEYEKYRAEREAERKKREMNNAKPALPPGD